MGKKEYGYYCKKCNDGLVKLIVKSSKHTETVAVKKCTVCKYQYGIKELTGKDYPIDVTN